MMNTYYISDEAETQYRGCGLALAAVEDGRVSPDKDVVRRPLHALG